MPRVKSPDSKRKILQFRVAPDLEGAIEQFAQDIDADNRSEAITKAIEYGILYYYYTKDD